MKETLLGVIAGGLIGAVALFTLTVLAQSPPAPQPDAITRAALHDMVVKGQQIAAEEQALQQEFAEVNAEFVKTHPGFHISAATLQIEADAPAPQQHTGPPITTAPKQPTGGVK